LGRLGGAGGRVLLDQRRQLLLQHQLLLKVRLQLLHWRLTRLQLPLLLLLLLLLLLNGHRKHVRAGRWHETL
jgi:hypothetical protein